MITPKYSVEQNETHVIIKITAPHANVKELDVQTEAKSFLFACAPYYLRLTFPIEFSTKEETIDVTKSKEFIISYKKSNPGEDFLDKPIIVNKLTSSEDVDEMLNEAISNLALGDTNAQDDTGYGFASLGGHCLRDIFDEFKEVFKINPFETPKEARTELRLKQEWEKFDPEHYIADLMERETVDEIISLDANPFTYSGEEKDAILKECASKVYNLTDEQMKECFYGLIDILFAYCYDRRTTYFEGTVESSWTICMVSGTLSCFATYSSAKEALVSGFRRSVCYPLYREFELSSKILEDLRNLLKLGKSSIINHLVDVYKIMDDQSEKYILNDIYIRDYLSFFQNCEDSLLSKVIEEVMSVEIKRDDLNLDIQKIENDIKAWAKDNLGADPAPNSKPSSTLSDSSTDSDDPGALDSSGSSLTPYDSSTDGDD